MPQKVVSFKGINRSVNEFLTDGECEELINVRPSASNMKIVRPKKVKFRNVSGDVYCHSFSNKEVFVEVRVEQGRFSIYELSDTSASPVAEIESYGEDYSIAFLGNKMLFSHSDKIYTFARVDNEYKREDAKFFEDIEVSYEVGTGYGGLSEASYLDNSDPKNRIFKEETVKHWSAAMGSTSNMSEIFGPIMIALNYSMSDGNELWTNKWIYVNPFHSIPIGENGDHMIYYEDGSTKRFVFKSYTASITIPQLNITADGENLVKSVNVYASRPIFPYDIDTMRAKTDGVHDREIYAKAMSLENLNIASELLYFQQSIPMSDFTKGAVRLKLNFGSAQAGEKVLEVDSGPVNKAGRMTVYNNRVHIYDSIATIHPQSVVCESSEYYTRKYRKAYVHIEVDGQTIVCNTTASVPSVTGMKISCCYPDARAKKILIATNDEGSNYCTIKLNQSSRYNYSYGEATYDIIA